MNITTSIAVLLLLGVLSYALYLVYYALALFGLWPLNKSENLSPEQKTTLCLLFPQSQRLNLRQQEKWFERLTWFMAHKRFRYNKNVKPNKEIEMILAATASFLTLGLNEYRMWRSLHQIVLRPNKYYSQLTHSEHWGEYRPSTKTIVFAVGRVIMGFKKPHDNLNLAFHEFAHALCYEMQHRFTWEARRFRVGFKQIASLMGNEAFQKKLQKQSFLREYGQTNPMEMFSVAVESYVENPDRFAVLFPELLKIIQGMLKLNLTNLKLKTEPES